MFIKLVGSVTAIKHRRAVSAPSMPSGPVFAVTDPSTVDTGRVRMGAAMRDRQN